MGGAALRLDAHGFVLGTDDRVLNKGKLRTRYHDGCQDAMVSALRAADLDPHTNMYYSLVGGVYDQATMDRMTTELAGKPRGTGHITPDFELEGRLFET